MTNLNLGGLEATETVPPDDSDSRLALAAVCVYIVSAAIAVLSAAMLRNYEGFGKATLYLSLTGFCGYRCLRGCGLKLGLAKLIAAIFVFCIILYGFGFSGISNYVQRKKFENLTANLRAIADKNRADLTQMGQKLVADLEQCQVQDVYPMLGGRTEIKRASLAALQSRVDMALQLLKQYSSDSQIRLEQMKRAALSTSGRELASSFNTGVDQGASKLQDAFATRMEYYARVDDLLRFLTLRYGTYRPNGNRLVFDRKSDSAKFDAMLNRLYKARNVWEP